MDEHLVKCDGDTGLFHVQYYGYAPQLNTATRKGHVILKVVKSGPETQKYQSMCLQTLDFDDLDHLETTKGGTAVYIVARTASGVVPCPWVDHLVILSCSKDTVPLERLKQCYGEDTIKTKKRPKKKKVVPLIETLVATEALETHPLDAEREDRAVESEEQSDDTPVFCLPEHQQVSDFQDPEFQDPQEVSTPPPRIFNFSESEYAVYLVERVLQVQQLSPDTAKGLSFADIRNYMNCKWRLGLQPPMMGSTAHKVFSAKFLRPLKTNMVNEDGNVQRKLKSGVTILHDLPESEWKHWLKAVLVGFFRSKRFFALYPFFCRKRSTELVYFTDQEFLDLAQFMKKHTMSLCFPEIARAELSKHHSNDFAHRVAQLCFWEEVDLVAFSVIHNLPKVRDKAETVCLLKKVHSRITDDGTLGPSFTYEEIERRCGKDLNVEQIQVACSALQQMKFLSVSMHSDMVVVAKQQELEALAAVLLEKKEHLQICKIVDPIDPLACVEPKRTVVVTCTRTFRHLVRKRYDDLLQIYSWKEFLSLDKAAFGSKGKLKRCNAVAVYSINYLPSAAVLTQILRRCGERQIFLFGNPYALTRQWKPKLRDVYAGIVESTLFAATDSSSDNPRFAPQLALNDADLLRLMATPTESEGPLAPTTTWSTQKVDHVHQIVQLYQTLTNRLRGSMFSGLDQVQMVYGGSRRNQEDRQRSKTTMDSIQTAVLLAQMHEYGYDVDNKDDLLNRVCHYNNFNGQKVVYSEDGIPQGLGIVVDTTTGGLNVPDRSHSIGHKRQSEDMYRTKKGQLVFQKRAKLTKSTDQHLPHTATIGRRSNHVCVTSLPVVHSWTPTNRDFDKQHLEDIGAYMIDDRELWKYPHTWHVNDYALKHGDIVYPEDLCVPQVLRCIYIVEDLVRMDEIRFLLSITGLSLTVVHLGSSELELDVRTPNRNYYNEQLCDLLMSQ